MRKNGPRRRLIQFARFKDALLTQIEEFGEEMVKSLTMIAALAVSDETKPSVQVRAVEAMTEFTKVLRRVMQDDMATEDERKREAEQKDQPVDPSEAVRRVLREYGVPVDGDRSDG